MTMEKEMRVLKSHKFTLNRDVANNAKYSKEGRCKHLRSYQAGMFDLQQTTLRDV